MITKKLFRHSVCGKECRDAWEVKTREPNCRECNRILLERSRAPTATTDNSTEVAALRQEVSELRSLVLRLYDVLRLHGLVESGGVVATQMDDASRMDTETPIGELSEDEEDKEEMAKDQPPEEKPKPEEITISGTGPSGLGLPSGIYKPFDGSPNDYVLASAYDEFYKKLDSVSIQQMLNQKHLTFFNCSEDGSYAQGWYLHAVKDANDRQGYAKEMPDASWRQWDNAAMGWVDIEDTVPPVIHARY